MVQTANTIFRDFATDGVPASGAHPPRKVEIREWGTWLEAQIGAVLSAGGKIYASKAQMNADLSPAANTPAIVMGDGANDGYYQKVGAPGSGSWVFRGPLPYSFIRASNIGAGSPNAIVATSSVAIPAADAAALITVNVTMQNTGPVSVSFNGSAALDILTSTGNPLSAGYLLPGMLLTGFVENGKFRLLTDIASSAIVAAAEAAQRAAEAAQSAAEAAAAGVNLPPVTANTMLVDNADGTARETKTFAEVLNLLSPKIKNRIDDVWYASDFGIKSNGSDQRAKLQSALDSGENIAFPPLANPIVCDGDLTISVSGQKLYGLASPAALSGPAITPVHTSGDFLKITAPNVILEKLRIKGPGRTSGLGKLAKFERPSTTATDIDGFVRDCILEGADIGAYFNGRGAFIERNIFNDTRVHIDLDHPTVFAAPTSYRNTLQGGARKYRILGNYFHSASLRSIRINGANAQHMHGVLIEGNFQDDVQPFFEGWLNDATVGVNNVTCCTGHVFILKGGRNISIAGGNYGGDVLTSLSGYGSLGRALCVWLFEGFVGEGVTITGVAVAQNSRAVMSIDAASTVRGLTFTGNTGKNVCLGNDNRTDPIIDVAGVLEEATISNNTFRTVSMSNNSNANFLRVTGSMTAVCGESNRRPNTFGAEMSTPQGLMTLPAVIGGRHLWHDSAGKLRTSAPYPTSDTAGTIVGTQT